MVLSIAWRSGFLNPCVDKEAGGTQNVCITLAGEFVPIINGELKARWVSWFPRVERVFND